MKNSDKRKLVHQFSTQMSCEHRINDKNVIVWSAIVRCYGKHGFAYEAK